MTTNIMMRTAVLAAMLAGPSSAAAAGADDCFEIIDSCAAALEDANWLEKIAIGNLCTLLLVGCSVT